MDSFLALFKKPIKELWEKNKIFLICFGLLILIARFRNIIFDMIVSSSKKLLEDATKQDRVLKTEQNAANDQANRLIEQSQALDSNKPTVDEDWHKNEK